MKHSFFTARLRVSASTRTPGLESEGVNPAARVPQEPIAPATAGFKETGTTGELPTPENKFGQQSPFANNEQEHDVIAEQQAAMEALSSAIARGHRLAAGLEEIADDLDAMTTPAEPEINAEGDPVPAAPGAELGLSPEAASVLQTSLNASMDTEGAGDMIAVESFQFDRVGSTKALAGRMRCRAGAVRRAVDKMRAAANV